MTQPVFRFAPSPTGELHLGHAFSALYTAQAAREAGGRFLLRIEDIDATRCRPQFTAGIVSDLAWLGIRWEEPVHHQSAHMDTYFKAQDRLKAMDLLYPCFCTRKGLAEQYARSPGSLCDPDGVPRYPGTCRTLSLAERKDRMDQGMPFSMRLDMTAALGLAERRQGGTLSFQELSEGPDGQTGQVTVDPAQWGDVILARKDIGTSYHMAVVVDDAIQSVSHVTRGHDLFHATHIHRLLQVLLELPEPVYSHHTLISADDGRKLAKRHGDRSLRALREAGVSPQAVRRMVGF